MKSFARFRPLRACAVMTLAALAMMASLASPALADMGNEEMKDARRISVNSAVKATTADYFDYDWYRFELSSAGPVQLSFTNQQKSTGSWEVELFDESGETVSKSSFSASAARHTSTKIGLPRGTYYVKVTPSTGSYTNVSGYWYSLTVGYQKSSSWETEFNTDFSTADGLTLGSTINGSTTDFYDYDCYKFSLPAAGVVELSFSNQQHSMGGWTVEIIDQDGEIDLSTNFPATAASHDSRKVGLPGGVYYVKVTPSTGSSSSVNGCTYALKVSYQRTNAWETEQNDDFGTADQISLGQTINGTTSKYFDEDWFRVNISGSKRAQVMFSNAQHSSGQWTVTLIDSKGNELDSNTFEASSSSHSGKALTLSTGTYYIKVVPKYAEGYTYSLKLGTPASSSGQQGGGSSQQQVATQTMYRLYNKYTGEHFYTASTNERDSLVRQGWTSEGTGWIAPKSGDPVYRLYNPYVKGGDHHYTMDLGEYNTLATKGWRKEGIGWYSGGTVKVYRQYNPYASTGTHNYTTSKNENDTLVKYGWRAEGIGWYAVRAK